MMEEKFSFLLQTLAINSRVTTAFGVISSPSWSIIETTFRLKSIRKLVDTVSLSKPFDQFYFYYFTTDCEIPP